MSGTTRVLILGSGVGLMLFFAGCDVGGVRRKARANRPPTVEITGGAVEGRDADYRVEFFWFGSDPDGSVDHFLAAIDDTCLCTVVDSVARDTTCVNDVATCLDAGRELAYESPDSIWRRVDAFSGSFNFRASTPIQSPAAPFESQDWHEFYIKAVDDRGAQSNPDSRFFNAITVAPTVRILAPVGDVPNNAATVSTFFNIRWLGRDEDSPESGKKPVGYQMKLVPIPSVQNFPESEAIRALTNPFTFCTYPNQLIPDSLIVPMGAGADSCIPLEEPTEETYLPWDWYPKAGTPYVDELLRFQNALGGDYVFGVRPVDVAGAVMPREAFKVANTESRGNVIKVDVNENFPVHPHITVEEKNLLGGQQFITYGQEWRVEVPVNTPLDFEWTATAEHYGGRVAALNYALDIPDPGCEVCHSPDGVGGWIGWGGHEGFAGDLIFTDDQADEQHVLYIRARDESFRREREMLAVIVMDIISFEFDRPAVFVDDFIVSGFNDCLHDAIVNPMVEYAIAGQLGPGEELDFYAGHGGGAQPCAESSTPREIKLSTLARYKLLYWAVSGAGSGSVMGSITKNPLFTTDTERYLSIYMQAGGNLIVWGRFVIGHMLGDYFPPGPYLPQVPLYQNSNYGPGTFVWDILKVRSKSDYVGRGTDRGLSVECGGIVGMEATPKALAEGFPAGAVDPSGYVDTSGKPRSAIWYDGWFGENNQRGAVASCISGPPSMRVAGMDTLYKYVSNSWSYEAGGLNNIRDACGNVFLSQFEDKPVILRYNDPFGHQGKVAWATTPLYVFAANYRQELHDVMRRLTDWMFE